ncbi:hypothetical protein [Chromobacterium amazonense]|uniref:hypothetical protein n=1 Tax=Chromobacterium amazonense TaxID=1382803 RepID=UPI003F78C46C
MSGRCGLSFQGGGALLGILLATALGALVTALALTSLTATNQSVNDAARHLEARQQAFWTMGQLARDVAKHRHFGCGAQPWAAQDFAAGHWRLWLPGRWLPHRKLLRDDKQRLAGIELEPLAGGNSQSWPQSLLSSCAATWALTGASAQWLGGANAPLLQLTPALPLQTAEQTDGLHAPSLQLWLPLERHYELRDHRLLARDRLGGLPLGAERLLLDNVEQLSIRVQLRSSCGEGAAWQWRAAEALDASAAQRLAAARLELAWRPDSRRARVERLSQDLPLMSASSCGDKT